MAVLVMIVVLSSCSDTPSSNLAELFPEWQLALNDTNRELSAQASVSTDEDIPFGSRVRLTDGDRLEVLSGGQRWQLYRRNAQAVYRREIQLPPETQDLSLRLIRGNSAQPGTSTVLSLPRLSQTVLLEHDMTIPATSTLNLSWNLLPVDGFEIQQTVDVRPIDCADAASANSAHEVAVAGTERSVAIPIDSLLQGMRLDTTEPCQLSVQLRVESTQTTPVSIHIVTRSPSFETFVDASPTSP